MAERGVALITPTTTMLREGIMQAATKVDAGFVGNLNWGFRNSSFKDFKMQHGEPIFKLTLFLLEGNEVPTVDITTFSLPTGGFSPLGFTPLPGPIIHRVGSRFADAEVACGGVVEFVRHQAGPVLRVGPDDGLRAPAEQPAVLLAEELKFKLDARARQPRDGESNHKLVEQRGFAEKIVVGKFGRHSKAVLQVIGELGIELRQELFPALTLPRKIFREIDTSRRIGVTERYQVTAFEPASRPGVHFTVLNNAKLPVESSFNSMRDGSAPA